MLQASKDSWDDNDHHAQSWVLNKLALCYNRTGRSYDAEKYFRKQIALREKMGYMPGVAIGLGNLSEVLIRTGRLLDATNTLERKIKISQQISDQFKEMVGRQDYGLALAYRGEFEESERQLKVTVEFLSKRSLDREECVSWAFYTLLNLLQRKKEEALESAKRSYQLASVQKRKRDMIRASWLLGVAYRLNEKLDLAEEQITESLKNDRAINLIEIEANILLELARLRYAQGDFKDALEKASEALMITERSGYVLQGADVNLFLAQYALEQEKDKAKAKEYAKSALKLAYCDGPPYYYKVAYEEAERMIARQNEEG